MSGTSPSGQAPRERDGAPEPVTVAPADERQSVASQSGAVGADGMVLEDLLVEDVSIDGMCGVY